MTSPAHQNASPSTSPRLKNESRMIQSKYVTYLEGIKIDNMIEPTCMLSPHFGIDKGMTDALFLVNLRNNNR